MMKQLLLTTIILGLGGVAEAASVRINPTLLPLGKQAIDWSLAMKPALLSKATSNDPEEPVSPEPIDPIRFDSGVVTFAKWDVVFEEGGIVGGREDVCVINASIPVYDFREAGPDNPIYIDPAEYECEVTFQNEVSLVYNVMPFIYIFHDNQDGNDKLAFNYNFHRITESDEWQDLFWASSFAYTGDLNLADLTLIANADVKNTSHEDGSSSHKSVDTRVQFMTSEALALEHRQ